MEPLFGSPFPIVSCRRLALSVAFYSEGMGGHIAFRWPEEGEAEFVVVAWEGGSVGLSVADSWRRHDLPPPSDGSGHGVFELCFTTPDLAEAIDRLIGAGGTLEMPPRTMPWGEAMAYVLDPDGYRLHLTSVSAPA